MAVALFSAALFLLALVVPAGGQSDYASQTTVVLEDPGTGASARLTVVSASYGWDTLEVRTQPTTQSQNFDRIRISLPGAELGPGVLVQLIDPVTGEVLAQSAGQPIGAGTAELIVPIAGTVRERFVVQMTMEAFIASAPTTTTVVRTTIITTTAAPTTTEAPTTTTTTVAEASAPAVTVASTTSSAAPTTTVSEPTPDVGLDASSDEIDDQVATGSEPPEQPTPDLTVPLIVGATSLLLVAGIFVFLRRDRTTDPAGAAVRPQGAVADHESETADAGSSLTAITTDKAPVEQPPELAGITDELGLPDGTGWVQAIAAITRQRTPVGTQHEQLDLPLDDERVVPIPFETDFDELDTAQLAPPPLPQPELFPT